MTEQRTNDQSSNDQTIENLKALRTVCQEQQKAEFVAALDKAIEALSGNDQGEPKTDGLRLSGSASDQLLQLAAQVRKGTTTPEDRTNAARYLTSLAGGKR